MHTVQEILTAVCTQQTVEAFRAALIRQAEEHDDYAMRAHLASAKRGAETQRAACLRAYDHARFGAVNDIVNDFACCIVAVNVAAKILGLSRTKVQAAMALWDESRNT